MSEETDLRAIMNAELHLNGAYLLGDTVLCCKNLKTPGWTDWINKEDMLGISEYGINFRYKYNADGYSRKYANGEVGTIKKAVFYKEFETVDEMVAFADRVVAKAREHLNTGGTTYARSTSNYPPQVGGQAVR